MSSSLPTARLLGIDVGSVRIGVALSCPLGFFASPLTVIERRRGAPWAPLLELMQTHAVGHVVVGQPHRLNGTAGLAVQAVEAFVTTLRAQLQQQTAVHPLGLAWATLPITLWDERLTTAQATRSLIAQNVRRAKRRQVVDKVAAALLLQSFLEAHREAHPPR